MSDTNKEMTNAQAENPTESEEKNVPEVPEVKPNWLDKVQKRNHDNRVKRAQKKLEAKTKAPEEKHPKFRKALKVGGIVLGVGLAGVTGALLNGTVTTNEPLPDQYGEGTTDGNVFPANTEASCADNPTVEKTT